MQSRRRFLQNTLAGSSLLALGNTAPQFLATAATATNPGEERVLVVVELGGGNDGLNTVIPYGDDLYHKARPTLRIDKDEVIRIDDHIGLNPSLRPFESLLENGKLAILQGIGYPNHNRSHFESMDIWHTADPRRKLTNGWLGRSLGLLKTEVGGIPAFHVSKEKLPLALQGSAVGVPTLSPDQPFELNVGQVAPSPTSIYRSRSLEFVTPPAQYVTPTNSEKDDAKNEAEADERVKAIKARRQLIRDLNGVRSADSNTMLQFVQRTSLRTFATIDQLGELLDEDTPTYPGLGWRDNQQSISYELNLVARMIQKDFGTRIYYVSMDGFDTHSDQRREHAELLETLASSVAGFFEKLKDSGDGKRVLLLTFSEFGRRVDENGSRGTDHGAGSCMFAAGPVNGGLVGGHPSLEPAKRDHGDLQHHTDFRRVYATILDSWLKCDSQRVLGAKFEHVDFLS